MTAIGRSECGPARTDKARDKRLQPLAADAVAGLPQHDQRLPDRFVLHPIPWRSCRLRMRNGKLASREAMADEVISCCRWWARILVVIAPRFHR